MLGFAEVLVSGVLWFVYVDWFRSWRGCLVGFCFPVFVVCDFVAITRCFCFL